MKKVKPATLASTLFALYTFAVTAPILEKLREEPDFFITQRISGVLLIGLCLVISLGIPFFLLFINSLASRIKPAFGRFFEGLELVVLSAALVLPHLDGLKIKTYPLLISTLGIGIALSLLIFNLKRLQNFIAFFSPAAILFNALFLFDPNIREGVFKASSAITLEKHGDSTPVVLIVFDEMPRSSLQSANGEVDGDLFPNFSKLADEATWFKQAKAVSTHTALALPAILTGQYPDPNKKSPTLNNHPNNLFTLLSASHKPAVLERVSNLCPRSVCGKMEHTTELTRFSGLLWDSLAIYLRILLPHDRRLGLPEITTNWGGFWTSTQGSQSTDDWKRLGRIALYREMLSQINSDSKTPLLLFAHHLLPHMPYQWTRDLNLYDADEFPKGYGNDNWQGDEWQIAQAYQRFLIQVQAADTVLGGYISALKMSGIWDKVLVVVTADHGVTFEPKKHRRGDPSSPLFQFDLMSVPLFIKWPEQHKGGVNLSLVQSTDILPTIAAAVHADVSWNFDGIALSPDLKNTRRTARLMIGRKRHQSQLKEKSHAYETIDVPISDEPDPTIAWRQKFFSSDSHIWHGPFRIGPFRKLIGQTLDSLPKNTSTCPLELSLNKGEADYNGSAVLRRSTTLPIFYSGNFKSTCTPFIAISIDGVITSTTQPSKGSKRVFTALLPEELIKDGAKVQLWGLTKEGELTSVLVKR